MEDLDTPRIMAGAADNILRTLGRFGLHSDETVLYQSQRTAAYQEALHLLQHSGVTYPCACSRSETADSVVHGIEGLIYPGTCRNGYTPHKQARTTRVRTDSQLIAFNDGLQGRITQSLEKEIGDFVVLRADGIFAYQLAVVVDDSFQDITHVVRGADLLDSTPRQIYLQRLLNLFTPNYIHLPIAVNAQGEKLSKQTLAASVDSSQPVATLLRVLKFLRQNPPAALDGEDLPVIWRWAITNWRSENLGGIKTLPAD